MLTPNLDSIIRPTFDGLTTFGSIRAAFAPETFSWKVTLGPEQVLKSVDSQHAEVAYEDGHEAYLITAGLASDAVGNTVPTSLSVSESDILTLTVKHHEGTYIYPVVAGAGWEGGFTTQVVEGPMDQQEVKEEEERIAREEQEKIERESAEESNPHLSGAYTVATTEVGPPEVDPEDPEDAYISSYPIPGQRLSRPFKRWVCEWWDVYLGCLPRLIEEYPKSIRWAVVEHGHFHYIPERLVWFNKGREGQVSCSTIYVRHEHLTKDPLYEIYNKGCYFNGRHSSGENIVARGMWRIDEYSWYEREICVDHYVWFFFTGYYSPSQHDPHEWWGNSRSYDCNFSPQDTRW